jgi:Uma2 family endonuclease
MAQPSTLPTEVRGEWIPMTWEEFLAWSSSEGQAEWVDGRGIAYVSNSSRHVRFVVFLGTLLNTYVRTFALGEVFFDTMLLRLPKRPSGRMPDVFVVAGADKDQVLERWVEESALLAVEVISEESFERDSREKRAEYEQAGVREYLMLDARPGRHGLTYLRLDDDGRYQPVVPDAEGRYHSAALPGFWLDPAWFGQDPLPNPLTLLRHISPAGWQRLVEEIERDSDA